MSASAFWFFAGVGVTLGVQMLLTALLLWLIWPVRE